MILESISKQVLTIGPDHKNHRGGIGALIDVYSSQYEAFNFIPTYKYFRKKGTKALFFLIQLMKIVWYLSTHNQIKVLHIHSAKNGSFYRKLVIICVAKFLFKKKIINHIHTGHFQHFFEESSWLRKRCIRFYLIQNDITLTVSDFWKSYFTDHFKLSHVYKLNNMVLQPSLGKKILDSGPTQFLFLGIINKNKGIFDLITVIGKNKEYLKNQLKLTICGSGELDDLQKMIRAYEIEEYIDFKGWVTGQQKELLLKNTDVYILPSYYEGLPISILEAMSYGKPIIATNVGGIPEIVESYTNGILIAPGNFDGLLKALLYYINDKENVSKHGNYSLQKIDAYYPKAITDQLTTIYSSLLY